MGSRVHSKRLAFRAAQQAAVDVGRRDVVRRRVVPLEHPVGAGRVGDHLSRRRLRRQLSEAPSSAASERSTDTAVPRRLLLRGRSSAWPQTLSSPGPPAARAGAGRSFPGPAGAGRRRRSPSWRRRLLQTSWRREGWLRWRHARRGGRGAAASPHVGNNCGAAAAAASRPGGGVAAATERVRPLPPAQSTDPQSRVLRSLHSATRTSCVQLACAVAEV